VRVLLRHPWQGNAVPGHFSCPRKHALFTLLALSFLPSRVFRGRCAQTTCCYPWGLAPPAFQDFCQNSDRISSRSFTHHPEMGDTAVSAELRRLSLEDDDFLGHDSASRERRILSIEERAALGKSFEFARRKLLDETDEGVLARLGDGRFTESFLCIFSFSFS
jgi:hypothetical protein